MKRRLITVFLLLFASFMLAGCDRGTTTTTTTQASGIYHTVVFYDSDDTIIATRSVLDGEGALAPSNPTKANNAQYTYTFNNWDTVFSNVSSDLHVRPVFTSTLNRYTVTFYNMDGTELSEQTIAYGSGATAPANPTYGPTAEDTYTFTGWDVSYSNIVGNLDVTAEYSNVTNQYTVTFYDEDGTTVLGTSTVDYGTGATAPATPTKAADAENTYVFSGWSVDFSNVTGNMSVTATFVSTNVEYTVTFYDEDGTTILGTSVVTYGNDALAPTSPTKTATAEFTYTFSGWSEAITSVSSTFSVTAVYNSVVNQYTVTFYDEDGTTLLGSSTVDYGTEAIAPADPFKASDATNAFSFNGWDTAFDNVVADMSTEATYLTVALGQSYDVNFYDEMGDIITTQIIAHGDSATAPIGPEKDTDAQYDYTFSGWSEFFTAVTSDLEIYPVYDTEVILYTVTFYDTDETTVLWTGQVGYGSSATAPTSPIKADGDGMTYTFIGWDTGFSMVTENLEIYPIFIGQPTGTFDRQNLLDLITLSFDEEDPESMILEMLTVTEMASEEELYMLMTNAMSLVEQLPFIDSAEEMQSWYAATKTLGFDKDMLMTLLYNMMVMEMTNGLEYALEEVTDYTTELATKAQMLLDYQAQILAIETEVATYCSIGVNPLLSPKCQNYWNALKDMNDYSNIYYNELDRLLMTDPSFQYYIWNDISNFEYALLSAMEFNPEDQAGIDDAQMQLDNYLTGLSVDELAIYTPLLSMYTNFSSRQLDLGNPNYSDLDVLDLSGMINIRTHLENLFFGNVVEYNTEDPEYYGYIGYLSKIDDVVWSISNIEEELEYAEEAYAEIMLMAGFMTDPLNEIAMMQGFETLYDGLDAVILIMDEEMFDVVMTFMMDLYINPENNSREEPVFNPMDLINPEDITMAAEKLNMILTAFYDTLDQADFDNIKVLLLAYLDDMFEADGMTPTERTAYLAVMGTTYDKYVGHFHLIVGEIQSFLSSIDETKVTSVMDLIPDDLYMMTDIDLVILASQVIDAVIGDDSIDVSGILQVAADLYFDMTTDLNPDPAEVIAVQTAIDLFITDTLDLVDIVKDLNPTYLSEENIQQIVELMGRTEAIMSWFTIGLDEVLVPVEYFNDDMFDDFISNFLGEEDPAIMLTTLTNIFGTIDKEDTYYKLRSLLQYGIGISYVRSFEGIQEWVGGLETFGHTQTELVDYFVNLLKTVQNEEESWFIDVVLGLVNDPTNEPLTEEAINIVLDDLQNMIVSMPPESFELVEKVLLMMMSENDYRDMEEFDDGMDAFEIPFSPEELFMFSQDLSAFLKLRLDSITETEMALLESYILIFITEYTSSMEMEPLERTAYITEINGLVMKYLGYADDVLIELTDFLDGLTVQSITNLMDYIMIMYEGGMNIYEQIVRGAQVIDGLYDPEIVDIAIIVSILNEIYFDIEYETYTPSELEAVRLAWATHLNDVEANIALAAALDPEALDPDDFPLLIALQQKVMYMAYLVMDPEAILTMPTFGFDYEMLVEIVSDAFEIDDTGEIDAMIIELCSVFNLGPTDFEELYYLLIGVGSVIQGMDGIESPMEVLAVFDGILSLGYTNAEIASFIMNGVMTFLVPDLPNIFDTTDLETELTNTESNLLGSENDLLIFNQDVENVIGQEPDTTAQTEAYDLWDAYNLREEHYAIFDNKLNNYSWENELFQGWLWNDIENLYDNGYFNDIDDMLENMPEEERFIYQDLLSSYSEFLYYENEVIIKQNDFNSAYGSIEVNFQPGYYLSDYLNDQSLSLSSYYMEQNMYVQQIASLNEEIEEMEDMAWLSETITNLLDDPANVILSEDVLVILLDQLEGWTMNPEINVIQSFIMIFDNGLEGMSTEELSAELMNAGLLMQSLFNTIDSADEGVITSWMLELVDAFAETQTSDPTELAVMQAYLEIMVTSYLPGLLGIPTEVGDFLLTMDEIKTQDLIDQLMILDMIDESDPNSDIVMAITIANIIDLLIGDGSLDYDAIYHPILGIVYGVNYLQGNPPAVDLLTLQATIDASLDDILLQAAVVALIDPSTTNPLELTAIQLLMEMVEDLGLDVLPLLGEEQN